MREVGGPILYNLSFEITPLVGQLTVQKVLLDFTSCVPPAKKFPFFQKYTMWEFDYTSFPSSGLQQLPGNARQTSFSFSAASRLTPP